MLAAWSDRASLKAKAKDHDGAAAGSQEKADIPDTQGKTAGHCKKGKGKGRGRGKVKKNSIMKKPAGKSAGGATKSQQKSTGGTGQNTKGGAACHGKQKAHKASTTATQTPKSKTVEAGMTLAEWSKRPKCERVAIRPRGCPKCRDSPGCTPSCFFKRWLRLWPDFERVQKGVREIEGPGLQALYMVWVAELIEVRKYEEHPGFIEKKVSTHASKVARACAFTLMLVTNACCSYTATRACFQPWAVCCRKHAIYISIPLPSTFSPQPFKVNARTRVCT